MDNELLEEVQTIRRYVVAIFIFVLIILLIVIRDVPGLENLTHFIDTETTKKDEPETTPSTREKSTPLKYPQNTNKAIALYKKYRMEHVASNITYTYDELTNDKVKTRYLVTKKAVKSYEKYLSYENDKAFAVSVTGANGWSGSGRASKEFAAEEALQYCEKYMPKSDKQCYLIDINGVFLGGLDGD